MPSPEPLVPPHRSVGLAFGASLVAALTAAIVVTLAVDPHVPTPARISVGLTGLTLVAALLIGVRQLGRTRGGLFFDRAGARVGVGLMSPDHVWWIPLTAIRGVSSTHLVRDDEATFTAALELRNGAALVLVETAERELADGVAELVARGCGLETVDAPPAEVSPPPGEVTLAVRRFAALQALVTSFGLAASLLGVLLLSVTLRSPLVALLFGPGLLLLGLALLTVAAIKRLGTEELSHRGGLWTHRWRLFGRTFAARTVAAPHPRWRLRAEPVRGVCLELVSPEGTLVMGSGATPRSQQDTSALLGVIDAFRPPQDGS